MLLRPLDTYCRYFPIRSESEGEGSTPSWLRVVTGDGVTSFGEGIQLRKVVANADITA